MKRYFKKYCNREGCNITKDDILGYDNTPEGNCTQLMMISDRWKCSYRLLWLIGLAELEYTKDE